MMSMERIIEGINQQISNLYCSMVDMDLDKDLTKVSKDKMVSDMTELKQIRDRLDKLLL